MSFSSLSQKWNAIWQGQLGMLFMRWAIILGVLGLSVLLALVGERETLITLLVLLVLLAGMLILLWKPDLGIFAILFGGFFVPFSGPGGVNLAVLATALFIGLWVLDMIIRQRNIYVNDPATALPILVFIIGCIISFGIGQLTWYPLARHAPLDTQLGGMAIYILSPLVLLAFGNLIRDVRWLKAFTWTFLVIGAVYILARLVPMVASYGRLIYQNGATVSSVFWIWLLMIPLSQVMYNNKLIKAHRLALIVMVIAVVFVAVVMSFDWKSGFIPPLAGAACLFAIRYRRRILWFLPLLIIGAIFVVYQAITTEEYSWFSRLDAWLIVINLSMVSPIFGIGFANYYWYTPLFSIMGWRVSFNSHSQYVDIFSQTGFWGLVCFMWIFWTLGKLAWRLKDSAPEGFERAFVYGALGSMAGMIVAGGLVDWVLPFTYNIGMYGFRGSIVGWLFLGGLLTINQVVKEKTATE